ncbi:MAG: hypothetical protein IPH52_16275 [Leptospiraceae bacterium]|nr:hypothetical protein [Leptospiraceae bacterium]
MHIIIGLLSSSLFYWYFHILSDCRNLNKREIESFPIKLNDFSNSDKVALVELSKKLMKGLKADSTFMTKSGLSIESFHYQNKKPIIDCIDRVLAKHYGFTEEELDYIINYDIKYRMGKELEGNDD